VKYRPRRHVPRHANRRPSPWRRPSSVRVLLTLAVLAGVLAAGERVWTPAFARFSANASSTQNVWTAAGCLTGQLLGDPGFEAGAAAPWTVTTPAEINNLPFEPPHSGSWDAWVQVTQDRRSEFLAQSIPATSGCTTATLSFWLSIDNAAGGGTMAVQLLNASGGVVATLATFPQADTMPYTQYSYNIAPYIGQTASVKFSAVQMGNSTTNYVIDDAALDTA
jgi:hypothetical protein